MTFTRQPPQEARRDGLFAGLSAALAGAILGNKLFRFNRNTTIVCGGVTGVLSGYQFYQGFLASNLARLRAEQAKRQQSESVFGEDLSANKFQ
ncbi:hypothetical protein WOLCODRAFT_147291 [Wolfiporia cocos MD-104 SS10]|uniref:Uncharacterized protein n=1 Tax=Wolfiporia cocos (strain MD-104) TaxID=742152 RepID=A0A2H3ITZ2_WOLCO|nr:hypothetical protein WOLCODRAFT_147291 [Wolfiporia cocos MD-104 SS10]